MDYDFSELTREQAIENLRAVLELELLKMSKREHAILAASLALLAGNVAEPSQNGSTPASVLG